MILSFFPFSMPQLSAFFFLAFAFLLPLGIKLPIYISPVLPLISDYSSFFIYPSEICLLLSFLFFRQKYRIPSIIKKKIWFFLLFFLISIIPSFFVIQDLFLYLFSLIRLCEGGIVLYLLYYQVTSLSSFIYTLGISLGLQSIIAIGQYIYQSSLHLSFLGESILHTTSINTAKIDLIATKILRSYGTFPHPNILGGYLSLYLLFLLTHIVYSFKKVSITHILFILLLVLGLFFTFSRTALLILLLGISIILITQKSKTIILSISIPILLLMITLISFFPVILQRFIHAPTENYSRISQVTTSVSLLQEYPLGVGPSQYIFHLQRKIPHLLQSWEMQPVHNAWILLCNEYGVILWSFIVFYCIKTGYQLFRSPSHIILLALLIGILIPSLTDHYFLTTYQGYILLMILIGGIFHYTKRQNLLSQSGL